MKTMTIQELEQALDPMLGDDSLDDTPTPHEVDVSLANHMVVVVPCVIAPPDSPQQGADVALVIPREQCRGGRPTRRGLWRAVAEAVRRQRGRAHHLLEVRAMVNGVLTPLLRINAASS